MKAAQHVSRDDKEEFGLTRDNAKEKSRIDPGETLGLALPNLASGQGSQLGLGELGECAHRSPRQPIGKDGLPHLEGQGDPCMTALTFDISTRSN